jgi:hypothetical protein
LQFNDISDTVARLEASHAHLIAALQSVHESSRMNDNSGVPHFEQVAATALKESGEETLKELSAETRGRSNVLLYHVSAPNVAQIIRLRDV